MVKVSLNGNTIYLQLLSIKGCHTIQPKLNCIISMIISVAKLSGSLPPPPYGLIGWSKSVPGGPDLGDSNSMESIDQISTMWHYENEFVAFYE